MMQRFLAFIAVLAMAGSRPLHAAPEGTLTWGLHVTLAPAWLDPAETEALVTPFAVLYALHDALLKPTPDGLWTPSLAESWSTSDDGLAVEFALRPGARFHDGEPVTADDVKFSFERYRGASAALLHEKVRDVEVVDAAHVRFHLREAWPDFLAFYGTTATGAAWIVPRKYVERVGDEAFKKHPIGAGPYRFVSFTPGVELVAEAFDGYWRKPPSVKRIVFKSMPEELTRAAALRAGEIDVAYALSGTVAQELQHAPGIELKAPLVYGVAALQFLDQWDAKSPWHDVRVRRAASLAVDRDALNDAESLGLSKPAGSIVPAAFDFALPVAPARYDPAQAKQLLAEAGYPDGFDAGDFYPFPPYSSMGEAVAGYLQAVGIRTRLRTLERAAFLAAWREKKLHGVAVTIIGSPGNAGTRIEAHATGDGIYAGGRIPEVDELFARQARETDRGKREALLHEIQQILVDRALHAPLLQLALISGVGPRVAESGLGLIPGFPFSAPFEDLRLRAP